MAASELPAVKFVVEEDGQGATLALARLVGSHYEIGRDPRDRQRISTMFGRALSHLLEEAEKRKVECEALYQMVVPRAKGKKATNGAHKA